MGSTLLIRRLVLSGFSVKVKFCRNCSIRPRVTMARVVKSGKEVRVYDKDDQLIGYGGVGNDSPLSNFYESPFTYAGHEFSYAECAIMWTKAVTFGDQSAAGKLLTCTAPNVAKRLGRSVKPFDPDVWVKARDEKVPEILYAKFTQNSELKQWLLGTGSAVLAEVAIEDSNGRVRYKDPIWGVAIGPSHKDIAVPDCWHKYGGNFLGKTLMTVRKRIAEEVN